ncbi:hypothetical protein [Streptomyces sp. NPDC004376]
MGKLGNFFLGTPEQREHNARFNHPDTDPNSPDYLDSNDRAAASTKKQPKKKGH